MTEIKKLLVLHFMDSNQWDWNWKVLQTDARYLKPSKRVIGFARPNRWAREMIVPDPMLNHFIPGSDLDGDLPL